MGKSLRVTIQVCWGLKMGQDPGLPRLTPRHSQENWAALHILPGFPGPLTATLSRGRGQPADRDSPSPCARLG